MIRTRLCIVSLMVLVSLLVAVPVPATSPPVAGDVDGMAYPFDPAEVAAQSSATIYPEGPRISVADSGDFERTPAAALCASNQYLVVYELQEESDPTRWYIYGPLDY